MEYLLIQGLLFAIISCYLKQSQNFVFVLVK